MAKGAYIGVDGVARKIKKAYIGVNTELPIYDGEIVTTNITDSNIGDLFTVSNNYYYFRGNGSTFTSNNSSAGYYYDEDEEEAYPNTSAKSVWTAKSNMTSVRFDYSVSSESNYDKLTISVGGITVVDGISGEQSGYWIGGLEAGQSIELTYSKDGSVYSGYDRATISNIVVTQDNRVIVNSEKLNIARRIKKAYVGVGGVARPFFTGGELAYYGEISTLSTARKYLSSASVGDYALIAGGSSKTVDVYSKSLVKSNATNLSVSMSYAGGITLGNYALFGKGAIDSNGKIVNAYDTSLTQSLPTQLGQGGYRGSAGVVGNYGIFTGGSNGATVYASVYAYDPSLTMTTASSGLRSSRQQAATANVGSYLLIDAGNDENGGSVLAMDTYNESLTRGTADYARPYSHGTGVGKYAIFAGGDTAAYGAKAYAYDTALTRTPIADLSYWRKNGVAVSVGEFAIFAGGEQGTPATGFVLDVYDSSLTKTIFTPALRDSKTEYLTATKLGDYAIFAGGRYGGNTDTNTVHVYTV